MDVLESLIESFGTRARSRRIAEVSYKEKTFPLYCISLGSQEPTAPALGIFAGAHGLEKIGSEVVLAYMRTLLELLRWDKHFQHRLQHSRLVFMPIVNPIGIVNRTRSNGNGVDLMRNSPLEGEGESGSAHVYRGHRITPNMPWYRGPEGAEMEIETRAILEIVETELLSSSLSFSVDVHSGFGAKDRFWFPYAHSRKPFPYLAEALALKEMYDGTYPNHIYEIEPMSRQYTINGDPWDYIFEENRQRKGANFYIPFCLEMGSWMWLRKNPLQVFSKGGVFDPVLPHRRSRILRRHITLFDFLHRALLSPESWLQLSAEHRQQNMRKAMELWYEK